MLQLSITYLNKLKSIDVWVRAEKKDAELQNIVAEQKLRTQRILGELIEDGQRKGTIASVSGDRMTILPERNNASTIEEIGLTHKQSSTFQQIASIPEEDFENFIEEKKQAVNNAVAELTTLAPQGCLFTPQVVSCLPFAVLICLAMTGW